MEPEYLTDLFQEVVEGSDSLHVYPGVNDDLIDAAVANLEYEADYGDTEEE